MKLVFIGTESDSAVAIKVPLTPESTFGSIREALLQKSIVNHLDFFISPAHWDSYQVAVNNYLLSGLIPENAPYPGAVGTFACFYLEDVHQVLLDKLMRTQNACPCCGGGSIALTKTSPWIEEGVMTQQITCEECDLRWEEEYTYAGATIL